MAPRASSRAAARRSLVFPTLPRRPMPPAPCAEDEPVGFWVADELAAWIVDTFIRPDGVLANDEHAHLNDARLGVLWTNAINRSQQREVMATAEIPGIQAGGWRRARFEWQLAQWFGTAPDFLLTFSGPVCRTLSDRAFCALVEHELSHCGQALDMFGSPKFDQTGKPMFAIRGHDLEQFHGVVARYGPTSQTERTFLRLAQQAPEVGDDAIDIACGVCGRAA